MADCAVGRNARKENKQRKKEAKKENKKRKVSLFRFVLYKTHENNKRKETKRNETKQRNFLIIN